MKKGLRYIAVTLCFLIVFSLLPETGFKSKAAGFTPVQLDIVSFSNGTLNISWKLSGVKAVRVKYHAPDENGLPVSYNVPVLPANGQTTVSTAAISGIKADYIYDIEVWMYNNDTALPDAGNSTAIIGKGLVYFISSISFVVNRLDETVTPLSAGGYEIGTKPRFNLKWAMPQLFSAASNSFNDANRVTDEMNTRLVGIYGDGSGVSALDFLISISKDETNLNNGTAVKISQQDSKYTAGANFGGVPVTADVYGTDTPGSSGCLSFNLAGRKDSSVTDPKDIPRQSTYDLQHLDIMPGTLYYMHLRPQFKGNTDALRTASEYEKNGYPVIGNTAYIYSYIRFQLSRDEADNVFATVFRLNRGSTNLPGMYYSIQINNSDSNVESAWTEVRRLRDSNFSIDRAMTNITGISPNNEIKYRIVVLTDDPDDFITSQRMKYTLNDDVSKPPVPKDIIIEKMTFVTGTVNGVAKKSGEVGISWEKPANWQEMKANNFYLHIVLNTFQSEIDLDPLPMLEADGVKYGRFPLKYRYVKSISANSPSIKEENGRLKLVLNSYIDDISGFDLFNREDEDGSITSLSALNAPESDYPRFLLPNTTYYMQMYTSKEEVFDLPYDPNTASMSNKSLVLSFTTPVEVQREVPIPKSFFASKNNLDQDGKNFIELQFDKVEISDWNAYTSETNTTGQIHYDLYMNTTSQEGVPFIQIGSTEGSVDVLFTGVNDLQKGYITARIDRFSPDSQAYTEFGERLKANTTYYFKLKARLVIQNKPAVESVYTALLPVTTVKGPVEIPDDSSKRPLAPSNFALAKDAGGALRRTGSSAVFSWERLETGVTYELICTTGKVNPDADLSTFRNDPLYVDFVEKFVKVYYHSNNLIINPQNRINDICDFEINQWLFPNRLYYFSLRSVKPSGKTSVWISIPVTTLLIDMPEELTALTDPQISFNWNYNGINAKTQDFSVWLKGPQDNNYKQPGKSSYSIVKDGTTYYGRIFGLLPNSEYSIKVFKGGEEVLLATPVNGKRTTRDSCHQLEAKWKGLPGYGYEVAVKSEKSTDYTVLSASDYELYTDESVITTADASLIYNIHIKTMEVTLNNGVTSHLPLESNMRYFIKVRSVKTSMNETAYSKYAGPIETRTEFSQADYDKEKQQEQVKNLYSDKIKELESSLFWKVSSLKAGENIVLLKMDEVSSIIENNNRQGYELDLSVSGKTTGEDTILIPSGIVRSLAATGSKFVIKVKGAEYSFSGGALVIDSSSEVRGVLAGPQVRDVFIKVNIIKSQLDISGIAPGHSQVSTLDDLKLQALGTGISYSQLKGKINDKLYNKNTGLVPSKLNELMDPYNANVTKGSQKLDEYVDELLSEIRQELSDYLSSLFTASTIKGAQREITELYAPLTAGIYINRVIAGLSYPFVNYGSGWRSLEGILADTGLSTFRLDKPGKHVVFIRDLDRSSYLTPEFPELDRVKKLMTLLDLREVFPGDSFNPYRLATISESVNLYDKVIGKGTDASNESFKLKLKRLELDTVLDSSAPAAVLTRQQLAALLAKACSVKLGIQSDSYLPKKVLNLPDETEIRNNLVKPVMEILDLKLLELKDGYFWPDAPVTRSEIAVTIEKLLELAGEL